MYKPVNVGTLGLLLQNGINRLRFDLVKVIRAGKVNEVCGIFWYGEIMAEITQQVHIILQLHEFHETVSDFPRMVPTPHHNDHHSADQEAYVTTMNKLAEVGDKEGEFNSTINDQDRQHTMT